MTDEEMNSNPESIPDNSQKEIENTSKFPNETIGNKEEQPIGDSDIPTSTDNSESSAQEQEKTKPVPPPTLTAEERGEPCHIPEPKWKLEWDVLTIIFHKVPVYVKEALAYVLSRFYYYTTPSWVDIKTGTRTRYSDFCKMANCEIKAGYRLDPLKCTDKERRQETKKHLHRHINNPWRILKRRFYGWLNR